MFLMDPEKLHKASQEFQSQLARYISGNYTGMMDGREISLHLQFTFDAGGKAGGEDILFQLEHQLSALHNLPRRRGRVFCLHCDSADCEHGLLPGPDQLFTGYQPQGKPEFQQMTTFVVSQYPRLADKLAASQLVFVKIREKDLYRRLLPVFGKNRNSNRILGQISCGYFSPRGGGGRLVFSFLILTGGKEDGFRPKLTTLSILSAAEETEFLLIQELQAIVTAAENLLDAELVSPGNRGNPEEHRRAAEKTLELISNLLQRREKRKAVRTVHAEDRRRSGKRPVSSAGRDRGRAGAEQYFQDVKSGHFALAAGKNRVHIFTSKGKHVTSIHLDRTNIRKRIQSQRWRPLSFSDLPEALKKRPGSS